MPKKHGFFIFRTKYLSTAQKIGEKLYAAAQAASQGATNSEQGTAEAKPEGETPKDAEVEEKSVEEEKK